MAIKEIRNPIHFCLDPKCKRIEAKKQYLLKTYKMFLLGQNRHLSQYSDSSHDFMKKSGGERETEQVIVQWFSPQGTSWSGCKIFI